ncbi:MAG TPA: deoxynucleoside kinase [Anaerolineae bacterium]|nr:deoxynucleoside kinase [Anaerolineae bacterium]
MAKRFVAIAGNVGVGKSTLVGLLADKLGWTPFYEAVDENPYLSDFYRDMRMWSFHSQVFFLSERLRHHRRLLDHPSSVLQDRSVYEDAEIFAKNLYRQGNMDERDYRVYRELYEVLTLYLPPPDLVVYLRASVPTLQKRVVLRGRDYERNISAAYLASLNDLYEEWIDNFTLCPILTINADDLDYVNRHAHLDLVAARITDRLAAEPSVMANTL